VHQERVNSLLEETRLRVRVSALWWRYALQMLSSLFVLKFLWYCHCVRQMERPSHEQVGVSRHRAVLDKTGLLPEVEVIDGITTLTDHGRYQVNISRLY